MLRTVVIFIPLARRSSLIEDNIFITIIASIVNADLISWNRKANHYLRFSKQQNQLKHVLHIINALIGSFIQTWFVRGSFQTTIKNRTNFGRRLSVVLNDWAVRDPHVF